jgi:catechol 2,3-dioxygenase-like lactoylglutathione lyase family enzyme
MQAIARPLGGVAFCVNRTGGTVGIPELKAQSISHVGLVCRDLGAVSRFYEEIFQFSRLYEATTEDGTQLVGLRLDDMLLELIQYPSRPSEKARTMDGIGRLHFGVSVQDFDAALAVIKHHGVPILTEPRQEGPAKWMFVTDPEDNPVELVHFEAGVTRSTQLFEPSRRLEGTGSEVG